MIRGAGIIFVTPQGKGLFLKRGPGGDWPSHWCFPGGTTEGGETAEQTAIREAIEELGFMPEYNVKGGLTLHVVTQVGTQAASGAVPLQPPPASTPEAPPIVPDELPPDIVQYTTFIQRVEAEFEPRLNGEHTGWAWAPINDPPLPLHPGCDIALKKFNWNELDIAEAIRDGTLASPQQYENMWLFAMRITGTGFAYRQKLNEFVLRKPEDYLTERFLARCNGLAVIVQHPKGNKLDSQEYAERNVGSMFLPYIKGDEVWGIAKIYDDETVRMLTSYQLSTSPAVVLRPGEGTKFKTEDGATILVETNPKLLDHLAICVVGVWDKGEEPYGVDVAAIGDSEMADEKTEKKEDKKADAGGGEMLDKVLSHMDSISSKMDDCMKRMDGVGHRLDSMEEERKKEKTDAQAKADAAEKEEKEKADKAKADAAKGDGHIDLAKGDAKKDAEGEPGKAKEVVADKSKKDADGEKEKDKEKGDAVGDSQDIRDAIAKLTTTVGDLAIKMPKPIGDADYHALTEVQATADSVYAQFGERAPRPLDGENVRAYQNRLTKGLQKHSPRWKDIDLVTLADSAFGEIQNQIYADAATAASSPDAVAVGQLRPVSKQLATGHTEIRFLGQPAVWMDQFGGSRRMVKKINPLWKGIQ